MSNFPSSFVSLLLGLLLSWLLGQILCFRTDFFRLRLGFRRYAEDLFEQLFLCLLSNFLSGYGQRHFRTLYNPNNPPSLQFRKGSRFHDFNDVPNSTLIVFVVGVELACLADDLLVKGMADKPINSDDYRFVHFIADDYPNEDFSLTSSLAHIGHPCSCLSVSDPQEFSFSQNGFDAGYRLLEFTDSVRSFNDSFPQGFLLIEVEKFPVGILQLLNQFSIAHLSEPGELLRSFRHEQLSPPS
jgi:hypothetical protein